MRKNKLMLQYLICGLVLTLALPVTTRAGQFEDFRFPREQATTKDGYPTPLSGKPITKTPIITKTKGASVKTYPEHYIPGKERLSEDEMRITALGSGGGRSGSQGAGRIWLFG